MAEPAVVIGQIGRPHGVRGSVHAKPTGPTLATLAVGESVEVRTGDAGPRRLVLQARAGTDERPILTFAGIATREQASALAGATIAVARERIPPLADADTFFVSDLVGCDVLLGDRPAGTVTRVHAAPANDVFEVSGEGGELLVPFTADAVLEVDPAARRIVLRPDLFGD
jgi:16S rRNA processing protein RimM